MNLNVILDYDENINNNKTKIKKTKSTINRLTFYTAISSITCGFCTIVLVKNPDFTLPAIESFGVASVSATYLLYEKLKLKKFRFILNNFKNFKKNYTNNQKIEKKKKLRETKLEKLINNERTLEKYYYDLLKNNKNDPSLPSISKDLNDLSAQINDLKNETYRKQKKNIYNS